MVLLLRATQQLSKITKRSKDHHSKQACYYSLCVSTAVSSLLSTPYACVTLCVCMFAY